MQRVRDWWRIYVEDPLDRVGVNWDVLFLWMWIVIMGVTVLRGGR